jgi:hypothetical protein
MCRGLHRTSTIPFLSFTNDKNNNWIETIDIVIISIFNMYLWWCDVTDYKPINSEQDVSFFFILIILLGLKLYGLLFNWLSLTKNIYHIFCLCSEFYFELLSLNFIGCNRFINGF